MQQNTYIPAADKGCFYCSKSSWGVHQFPSHGYDFYFFVLCFKYET